MKRKIIVIVVLLLAAAGIYGYYQFNKGVASIENVSADYSIEADELLQEFIDNETASQEKYLNKVVEVTGTVESVQKDIMQIQLQTEEMMSTINCGFPSDYDPTKLPEEGSQVKIKGNYSGYLFDLSKDINFVNCTVVK